MLEALFAAQRSPDPNTQVGAVIVNSMNRRIASGYNAWPNNIPTDALFWARDDKDPLKTKYPFVVHAEKNAIYNAVGSVAGCTLYVTLYPCNECAKDIIQAGITRVVYLSNKYAGIWQTEASALMFKLAGVSTQQHEWEDKATVLSCLKDLSKVISNT
jgi:dCMP deaminase